MKCWRMNELGDPWALLKMEELDLPAANGDQIKISVEAADLNFAIFCNAREDIRENPPFTPGMTAAGKIIECSPNSKFKIGERMWSTFSSWLRRRGTTDESQCQLIPRACRARQLPPFM